MNMRGGRTDEDDVSCLRYFFPFRWHGGIALSVAVADLNTEYDYGNAAGFRKWSPPLRVRPRRRRPLAVSGRGLQETRGECDSACAVASAASAAAAAGCSLAAAVIPTRSAAAAAVRYVNRSNEAAAPDRQAD